MIQSLVRIYAMYARYLYLHKRRLPKWFEIFFWPVMDLLLWGFVSMYIQTAAGGNLSKIIVFLISGLIFWDILYRTQLAITTSFLEEISSQNIINLMISPLKIWEWFVATFLYGMTKVLIITCLLTVIAGLLYHFNLVDRFHFHLIVLSANLLMFGWALGILTSGLVLRWGHAAETVIWVVPFLIQPISAIYYPVSILPVPLQWIAKMLPSSHIFEGMRAILTDGSLASSYAWSAFGLNLGFFILGGLFFQWMYKQALVSGRLVRFGMD